MLILSLAVTDYAKTLQKILHKSACADGIELRLDYMRYWDIAAVSALRRACQIPVIFTLRSRAHGGHYPHSENKRLEAILALCALNPDYLDLEYDLSMHAIHHIRHYFPAIKIILSYHNLEQTPTDLLELFQTMYQPGCYAYKIATYAQSSMDALRMLHCVWTLRSQYRMVGLCMGEAGECTRILGPVVGSLFTYASWDVAEATAPGQLSLEDLTTTYHYRRLNAATKVYAVLGDPVHLSVGHILHNRAIDFLQQNAVYLRLRVQLEELAPTLVLLHQLPFWGLSITMPLKEVILPCLDDITPQARAMHAVNTVLRQAECFIGYNTDGPGALHALSAYGAEALVGKTLLVIGAGGAARAIAYQALPQHKVIIVNRSMARAEHVAKALGCEAHPLSALPALIDGSLCVNTLPELAYQNLELQALWQSPLLSSSVLAMDIVYQPTETIFLRLARAAGWQTIPGHAMYIAQALLQIELWFAPDAQQIATIKVLMQRYFANPIIALGVCPR